MLDRTQYIAIAVDIDGEVNLVRKDGQVEMLFPRETVLGCSEIGDGRTKEPISWLFYFTTELYQEKKLKKLHLDYLDGEE